ncbi:MAG: SDR family oxidoreductase [Bryobacteraceae bacterium]|nr:SDR family oxidoreductase [Bryobacteraceae bacterium]
MDLGLKDKVAVVAAASHGLGKAVARALTDEGAKVAICARDARALDQAAQEMNGEVLAHVCDVTKEDEVARFLSSVRTRFGPIDICVANAGGPPSKSFEQTSVADWENAVQLNLMSTLYFARGVLPEMKERRWGRLITITSVSVKHPLEGLILSNSVRAAVMGLVKSLANEYGPYQVLVNNVCPGYTATDRLNTLAEKLAGEQGLSADAVRERWAANTAVRRVGRPEEFASVVAFLASERASYITGQSISIDGGFAKGIL